MANAKQLALLKAGVEEWNRWREQNHPSSFELDLSGVNLNRADLRGANFKDVDFRGANLSRAKFLGANLTGALLIDAKLFEADLHGCNMSANLAGADLHGANLARAHLPSSNLNRANLMGVNLSYANLAYSEVFGATFSGADLSYALLSGIYFYNVDLHAANLAGAFLEEVNLTRANLRGTNLSNANLRGANLTEADLRNANLTSASLSGANLLRTNLENAIISKSNIYGSNVWDLRGEIKEQRDLIITPEDQSPITVDNIEIAQFIYLILNNKKIRDAINTLTSKTVLILGRFTPERKKILDALRDKLRKYNLLPIVFDFDRPTDKDFTETIKTLAGMSYFVIADVTNPKSSPLELQATVPDYQIPFVPIIQEGEYPFAMMVDLQKKYGWVLDTISYDSLDTLIEILKPHIIDPAIKKRDELRLLKAKEPTIISGRDLLGKK